MTPSRASRSAVARRRTVQAATSQPGGTGPRQRPASIACHSTEIAWHSSSLAVAIVSGSRSCGVEPARPERDEAGDALQRPRLERRDHGVDQTRAAAGREHLHDRPVVPALQLHVEEGPMRHRGEDRRRGWARRGPPARRPSARRRAPAAPARVPGSRRGAGPGRRRRDSRTSNSRPPQAGILSAACNAGIVFSGARRQSPRWARRSMARATSATAVAVSSRPIGKAKENVEPTLRPTRPRSARRAARRRAARSRVRGPCHRRLPPGAGRGRPCRSARTRGRGHPAGRRPRDPRPT